MGSPIFRGMNARDKVTKVQNLKCCINCLNSGHIVESCSNNLSPNEKLCETFFVDTTFRDKTGRFVVKLPFKENPETLGDSKEIAKKRFMMLEQRLTDLRQQYIQFMNEYIQLNHMTLISGTEILKPNYFIPHHCVLKPTSSTTNLRVV